MSAAPDKSFKFEKEALLYVTGRGFGGGIPFGYLWGQWWVIEMPPYLQAALGRRTPADAVIDKLRAKGFTAEWVVDNGENQNQR